MITTRIAVSHPNPIATASVDALMEECERMEAELGDWLARSAAMLKARRDARSSVPGAAHPLRPSLWRALIHVWTTSPAAKRKYSEEARASLLSAVDSMDPRTLMSLVGAIQEESSSAVSGSAAA